VISITIVWQSQLHLPPARISSFSVVRVMLMVNFDVHKVSMWTPKGT
jgi:hypothetical protein